VQTEGILAAYAAEFLLDLIVGFMGKDLIMNRGARLKVHEGCVRMIAVINRF
jgi:hypothetical protein